jgi:hypothetical protein
MCVALKRAIIYDCKAERARACVCVFKKNIKQQTQTSRRGHYFKSNALAAANWAAFIFFAHKL